MSLTFITFGEYMFNFDNCPAPAPSPSSRFGPANEVKKRLHCQALQRLSGLTKALALFLSFCGKIGQNVEFVKVGGSSEDFGEGASEN
ncbi:hypothetical protein AABM38_00285 [Heyndrickxia sp. MSNUG]|uniref:hypothetical protein n=1 Tax=Heyndrickxia sp. MSNUG TaxID=3136677 RepID=UPI003C2E9BB0